MGKHWFLTVKSPVSLSKALQGDDLAAFEFPYRNFYRGGSSKQDFRVREKETPGYAVAYPGVQRIRAKFQPKGRLLSISRLSEDF